MQAVCRNTSNTAKPSAVGSCRRVLLKWHRCPFCEFETTELRHVDTHVAQTGHDMYSRIRSEEVWNAMKEQ